jgi:hypothetical protein
MARMSRKVWLKVLILVLAFVWLLAVFMILSLTDVTLGIGLVFAMLFCMLFIMSIAKYVILVIKTGTLLW